MWNKVLVKYIINELLSRSKSQRKIRLAKFCYIKQLHHATGLDKSDLASEIEFIPLKTEVDKLGINRLVNVLTSLNKLKEKHII